MDVELAVEALGVGASAWYLERYQAFLWLNSYVRDNSYFEMRFYYVRYKMVLDNSLYNGRDNYVWFSTATTC